MKIQLFLLFLAVLIHPQLQIYSSKARPNQNFQRRLMANKKHKHSANNLIFQAINLQVKKVLKNKKLWRNKKGKKKKRQLKKKKPLKEVVMELETLNMLQKNVINTKENYVKSVEEVFRGMLNDNNEESNQNQIMKNMGRTMRLMNSKKQDIQMIIENHLKIGSIAQSVNKYLQNKELSKLGKRIDKYLKNQVDEMVIKYRSKWLDEQYKGIKNYLGESVGLSSKALIYYVTIVNTIIGYANSVLEKQVSRQRNKLIFSRTEKMIDYSQMKQFQCEVDQTYYYLITDVIKQHMLMSSLQFQLDKKTNKQTIEALQQVADHYQKIMSRQCNQLKPLNDYIQVLNEQDRFIQENIKASEMIKQIQVIQQKRYNELKNYYAEQSFLLKQRFYDPFNQSPKLFGSDSLRQYLYAEQLVASSSGDAMEQHFAKTCQFDKSSLEVFVQNSVDKKCDANCQQSMMDSVKPNLQSYDYDLSQIFINEEQEINSENDAYLNDYFMKQIRKTSFVQNYDDSPSFFKKNSVAVFIKLLVQKYDSINKYPIQNGYYKQVVDIFSFDMMESLFKLCNQMYLATLSIDSLKNYNSKTINGESVRSFIENWQKKFNKLYQNTYLGFNSLFITLENIIIQSILYDDPETNVEKKQLEMDKLIRIADEIVSQIDELKLAEIYRPLSECKSNCNLQAVFKDIDVNEDYINEYQHQMQSALSICYKASKELLEYFMFYYDNDGITGKFIEKYRPKQKQSAWWRKVLKVLFPVDVLGFLKKRIYKLVPDSNQLMQEMFLEPFIKLYVGVTNLYENVRDYKHLGDLIAIGSQYDIIAQNQQNKQYMDLMINKCMLLENVLESHYQIADTVYGHGFQPEYSIDLNIMKTIESQTNYVNGLITDLRLVNKNSNSNKVIINQLESIGFELYEDNDSKYSTITEQIEKYKTSIKKKYQVDWDQLDIMVCFNCGMQSLQKVEVYDMEEYFQTGSQKKYEEQKQKQDSFYLIYPLVYQSNQVGGTVGSVSSQIDQSIIVVNQYKKINQYTVVLSDQDQNQNDDEDEEDEEEDEEDEEKQKKVAININLALDFMNVHNKVAESTIEKQISQVLDQEDSQQNDQQTNQQSSQQTKQQADQQNSQQDKQQNRQQEQDIKHQKSMMEIFVQTGIQDCKHQIVMNQRQNSNQEQGQLEQTIQVDGKEYKKLIESVFSNPYFENVGQEGSEKSLDFKVVKQYSDIRTIELKDKVQVVHIDRYRQPIKVKIPSEGVIHKIASTNGLVGNVNEGVQQIEYVTTGDNKGEGILGKVQDYAGFLSSLSGFEYLANYLQSNDDTLDIFLTQIIESQKSMADDKNQQQDSLILYNKQGDQMEVHNLQMDKERMTLRNTDFDVYNNDPIYIMVKNVLILASYSSFKITKQQIQSIGNPLEFEGIDDKDNSLKTLFCHYEHKKNINILFKDGVFQVIGEDDHFFDANHIIDTNNIVVQIGKCNGASKEVMQLNDPMYQQLLVLGYYPILQKQTQQKYMEKLDKHIKSGKNTLAKGIAQRIQNNLQYLWNYEDQKTKEYYANNWFVKKTDQQCVRIFVRKTVHLVHLKNLVKGLERKKFRKKLKKQKKYYDIKKINYRKKQKDYRK